MAVTRLLQFLSSLVSARAPESPSPAAPSSRFSKHWKSVLPVFPNIGSRFSARRLSSPLRLCAGIAALLLPLPASATGWVERTPDALTVHLTLFDLPDPARTDPATRAELAVQREYLRLVPGRLAARAAARGTPLPADAPPLRVQLHRFSGIQVEGVESTLLAIAGNVAPDVLYVNFRQSQTYIDQGFLAPLDDPADAWFSAFPPSEVARRVPPAIDPVVRRPGPDGVPHVWALPSGPPLSRVVLFRRDLFDAAGLPPPSPSWTWDDFLADCRALADPARGVYAIGLSRGKHESYLWLPFLWGAGGEALAWDPAASRWNAVFDSPEAAAALDFYLRLTTEPWTDASGRLRRGYAIKDTSESSLKWRRGQLAMMFAYLDSNLFASLNPDLTGMAPMPVGPARRGTEINARMMGLFAGVTNPLVRDAAWEYIAFQYSPEAEAVRVRTLVEGGLGRFVSPERLAAAGFAHLAADFPPEWRETAAVALADARPEPYGQNANVLYDILTEPIRRAEELALSGRLPETPADRLPVLLSLLRDAREKADAVMLGRVPPRALARRRAAAAVLLLAIVAAAGFALRSAARAFLPSKNSPPPSPRLPSRDGRSPAGHAPRPTSRLRPSNPSLFSLWPWRTKSPSAPPRLRASQLLHRLVPWLLIAPAALTIFVWAYIPLARGSLMAFRDYRIFGASPFVGLDNFANLLWDSDWWRALWTSARYTAWVVALTFFPPVLLAVLLQEIPRGKVFFRLLYYLPAAITGLVVTLLWKTFFEPSEAGLVNRLVMAVPLWGWLLLAAAVLLLGVHLARRLFAHAKPLPALLVLAAAALAASGVLPALRDILRAAPQASLPSLLSATLPEPVRWLDDSRTALFSCVLPMLWAGVGPGCLIYLAALKGIPDELYEAADMDGATFTDKFLFVVLPILRPLLLINFVGVFIAAWQAEANILAMTAGGAGTEVAGLHIFYKAFLFLRFGPATAAAWMLATLLVGFTVYQLRILSRVQFRANP